MGIAGVYINADELEALHTLPHLAIAVYLLAMRPRMDFARATLGIEPAISWQALTEWVYQEPTRGVQRGAVSIKQVRNAVAWLERAGLVRFLSSERRLIFGFPKASAPRHVLNKPGSNRADQPGRPPQRENTPEPGRAIHNEPGKHRGDKDLLRTTTTNVPLVGEETAANAAARLRLEWSNRWTANMRAALSRQLERAPIGDEYYMPQALLDELEGAMDQEEIRSPPNYLRALVNKALQGDFVPAYGVAVAHQRAKKSALSERGRATVLAVEPPRQLTAEEEAALSRQFPNLKRSKERKP